MKNKVVLGIFAHPDDEVIISGFLLRAISLGADVHLITATAGEAGKIKNPKLQGEKTKDLRTKEYNDACIYIGTSSHQLLDMKDGQGSNWDEQILANQLKDIIVELKPDYVITFPLNGGNGHPDHKKVSKVTYETVKLIKKQREIPLLFLNTYSKSKLRKMLWFVPKKKREVLVTKLGVEANELDFMIKLNRQERNKKLEIAKLHKSQFPDEKGRYYKLPIVLFKYFSKYENYRISDGGHQDPFNIKGFDYKK